MDFILCKTVKQYYHLAVCQIILSACDILLENCYKLALKQYPRTWVSIASFGGIYRRNAMHAYKGYLYMFSSEPGNDIKQYDMDKNVWKKVAELINNVNL